MPAWCLAFFVLGFCFAMGVGFWFSDPDKHAVRKPGNDTPSNSTMVVLVEDESPEPNWYGKVTFWYQTSYDLIYETNGSIFQPFLIS